eukprot:TRINITY_DN25012_c0_g1_i1.p1 TRINITY_DN25012_c0_g1~~TRINITY_DN25012_c0_g1_i1.p1  ORF type:complete len:204 (+),score=30.08 TRINITY_DN25012_c0_g1_i1:89-700(+)
MAISSASSSSTLPLLTLCNSTISTKPKSIVFSFPSNVPKLQTLKSPMISVSSRPHFSRVFAAPEVLESQETADPAPESLEVGGSEVPGSSTIVLDADAEKMAPKQKIRIKLRSYWVPLIEDSCKQIMDAARTTNAKIMGPVPLPTKKRIYCVLKSPHVHKDARFHFEIRTHQRLIDILYPTAQTIDSLMQLDLPPGVDVEVKL